MAKFCRKCGKPLIGDEKFCANCGAKISSSKPSNGNTTSSSTNVPTSVSGGSGPRKKSSLCLILAAALLIEAVIAAFLYPGFLRKEPAGDKPSGNKPTGTVVSTDDRGLSDEVVEITEPIYHSEPVDLTPMEGLRVTADAGALYDDTKLTVTPISEVSDYVTELDKQMQEEGNYIFSMWEVDAGLEEGQVLPGEYKVELDLEKMGVPESLYEDVRFIRIDDSGNMTELVSEVEGGTAYYYSDNNSIITAVIWGVGLFKIGKGVYDFFSERSNKYKYYWNSTNGSCEGETKWGKYRIVWRAYEMDPDFREKKERLKVEEERLKQQAQEEYDREEKLHKDTYGSLYWLFHKNLSVADRLKELKETDETYLKLEEEIKVPDSIKEVSERIETAFEYLGDHVMFRMPKHRVEFMLKKIDIDNKENMGGAQSGTFYKTYVDIMVPSYEYLLSDDYESVCFRDNMLLTITHELGHVCQERYHIGSSRSDDNRFDEMVALVLESDAKDYYKEEGLITTDPELTQYKFWSTLICPIEQRVSGHKGDKAAENAHKFMQSEGYLLSNFVLFIRSECNKDNIDAWHIMRYRSFWDKPEIPKILMSAFKISEKQFDELFRKWCLNNRAWFKESIESDTQAIFNDPQYQELDLKDNEGVHIPLSPKGQYSAPVRRVRLGKNPAAILIVLDKDVSEKHPEAHIVPTGNYKTTNNGAYIAPTYRTNGKIGIKNFSILEVYGTKGKNTKYDENGYTIWTVTAPEQPVISQSDTMLKVQLPKAMGAAKAGVLDGLQINVTNDAKETYTYTVNKEDYGTEISMNISDVLSEGTTSGTLKITLQEFVHDTQQKRLFMPESKPVEVSIGTADLTVSGLVVDSDSLCALTTSMLDMRDSDSDVWKADNMPSSNSLTIKGDKMKLELGGFSWHGEGYKAKNHAIDANVTCKRSGITLSGEVVERSDTHILCSVTENPGEITAGLTIHTTGEEIDQNNNSRLFNIDADEQYVLTDIETASNHYESLNGSRVNIELDNGKVVRVFVELYGTYRYNSSSEYDGEHDSGSGEEKRSCEIRLKNE